MPQLQRLGESRLVVPPQLSSNSGEAISTAVQRDSEIEQLARAYPELAPSSGLLPSLAEESEAIQKSTSAYDPAISDLLAFGRALHPLHHRQSEKTVPVIAIAGGSAGGLVRVFQLVPEVIGWDEQSNIKLQDEAFRGRVQGLWYGNGSRIQQLQFARSNGEPTEWLAVRYGGTTSILRVILRDREVPTLYDIPHPPALQADVEIRLEVKHIVTVSMQLSRGVPHADVCFNPCNPQEFAIVNQSSRWSTWRVASINKKVDVWIAEAGVSGHLTGDKSDDNGDPEKSNTHLDGWGAVRWINYGNCLLVCNRRRISCCKLQDSPTYFSLPELGLKKTKDWILDIKEASTNPEHIFVVTSSCIFWLQLTFERLGDDDQLQLCAKTLLTWRHFRNELDASLSMQLVVLGSSMPTVAAALSSAC